MGDTIVIETPVATVLEVSGLQGPQGPQGPKGDPGDVAGSIDWSGITGKPSTFTPSSHTHPTSDVTGFAAAAAAAAPVQSVNGQTGAVVLDATDVGAAATTHAVEHEFDGADPIQAKAVLVTTDVAALNGVYFWDGTTTSGRPNFFRTGTRKNTKIVYNSGTNQWNLVRNLTTEAVGVDGPDTVPWGNSWEEFVTPTSVEVTQLPLESMVQKLAETGGAATATTSEDGLMSSSDKTKLNGIAAGAEVNVQANWTEADSGSDAFIQNKPSTFAPSAHSSSHSSSGSDPLAPSDIGAQSIFATEALGTVTADVTLTAARAKIYTLNTTTSGLRILLPTTNVQTGDVVQIRFASQNGSTIAPVRGTLTGFFGNSIRSGQQVTFIAESTSGTSWEEAATNRTPPETITLTAGDVVVGKATSGAGTATQVSIGTEENSVARGNHVHGNITNDGKLGSTSGLPVVTTTAGAVTTLALGTANQVLRVNSGASGVEFADPAASGVSSVASSASDVLGVSGANITGVDAGSADRLVFWDDSANKLTYLEAGSGLSISGTTMTVTATGGATNLWIPASAWIPRTTGGCGVDSREIGATNRANVDELLFDTGTEEFAQALVVMPSNYNNSTLTARFYWTAASGSGGVAWGISGRAYGDDDALDQASGTRIVVTDTFITANDVHVTSATSAVTIDGTPAANKAINFQISREVGNGSDTLAVDARLLGVEILFN